MKIYALGWQNNMLNEADIMDKIKGIKPEIYLSTTADTYTRHDSKCAMKFIGEEFCCQKVIEPIGLKVKIEKTYRIEGFDVLTMQDFYIPISELKVTLSDKSDDYFIENFTKPEFERNKEYLAEVTTY